MFDIIFYTANEHPPHDVEVSKDIYEWLAKSEFSKIGKSVPRKIEIDGEEEKLYVVHLSKGNRKKLRTFFVEEIIQETDAMLTKLGDSPSKQEYQEGTYRLKKLLELLKCIENPNYQYLQRF